MNEIRFIDLFSGIGGFRLGLEKTNDISPQQLSTQSRGWNENEETIPNGYGSSLNGRQLSRNQYAFSCVWSCDFNKYANQVYTKRFGDEGHYTADIRGVNPEEIPDFDLLCAGFPCQAFSVAGKRKGFQDTRGTLFFEICRIAEAKRPTLLLLENVKGLLNHDGGRTFTIILQTLDELGYWLEWQVLNSKYFGVPQNRERVFIVGHLRGTGRQEIFPIAEGNGIPSKEFGGRKGIASALDANYFKGARRQRTFVATPEIANTVDQDGYLRFGQRVDGIVLPIAFRRIRRLTPIECERLQGFPDGWTEGISDTQRYRVLGNAVTVNVIEFLGELIKSLFTNKEDS